MSIKSILSILVIAAILIQLMIQSTDARILTVSKRGFANSTRCFRAQNATRSQRPCLTIRQAMQFARAGDTIEVWPGVYLERVIFTRRNITIKSRTGNVNDVKIVASMTNVTFNGTKMNIGVRMTGDNVTLQDVTVQIIREDDTSRGQYPKKGHKLRYWEKYPDIGAYLEKGRNQRVIGCLFRRGRTNSTTPKSVGIYVDATSSGAIIGSNSVQSTFPISILSYGNSTQSFENNVYYAIFTKANAVSYFDTLQVSNNPANRIVAVVRPARDIITQGPFSQLPNKGAYTYSPTIVGFPAACGQRRIDNRMCVDNAWYNATSGNCECDATQGFLCHTNNLCIVNTTFYAPATYYNSVGVPSNRFTDGYYDKVVRLRAGDQLVFQSDYGQQVLYSYDDRDSWDRCSTANRRVLFNFTGVTTQTFTLTTPTSDPRIWYLSSQKCAQGVKFIVVSYLRGIAAKGSVFQTPLVRLGEVSSIWGPWGGFSSITVAVDTPVIINPSDGTDPAALVLFNALETVNCTDANITRDRLVAPTQPRVVNPLLLGLPGSYIITTSDVVGCNYSQRIPITVTAPANNQCFQTKYFNIPNATVSIEAAGTAIADLLNSTVNGCIDACWANPLCKFAVFDYTLKNCSLLNYATAVPINVTNTSSPRLNHVVFTAVNCDGTPRDFGPILANLHVNATNGTDAPGFGFSPNTPAKTIQYVLPFAVVGTTIWVAPGTYTGDVVIPFDDMSLVGNTTGATIQGNVIVNGKSFFDLDEINVAGAVNLTNVQFSNITNSNITAGTTAGQLILTNTVAVRVLRSFISGNITVTNAARLLVNNVSALIPGSWIAVTGTSFANSYSFTTNFRASAADVNNNRFYPPHGCGSPVEEDDFTTDCRVFTRRTASGHCACAHSSLTCERNQCVPAVNSSIVILNTSATNANVFVPLTTFGGGQRTLGYSVLNVNRNDNIVFNYGGLATTVNTTYRVLQYSTFQAYIYCNVSDAREVGRTTGASLTVTVPFPQQAQGEPLVNEVYFGDADGCANGMRVIVRANASNSATPQNVPVSITFPFFGPTVATNYTVPVNTTVIVPYYDNTTYPVSLRDQTQFLQCTNSITNTSTNSTTNGTNSTNNNTAPMALVPNDAYFAAFNITAEGIYYFTSTIDLCVRGLGKAVVATPGAPTTPAPSTTAPNSTANVTLIPTNATNATNATGNATQAPNATVLPTVPPTPTPAPGGEIKAVLTIDGNIAAFQNQSVVDATERDLTNYYFGNNTNNTNNTGDSVKIDSVIAGSVIILYTVRTARPDAVQQLQQKSTVAPPIPALQAAYFAATGVNVSVDPTRTGSASTTTCPTIPSGNTTVYLNSTAAWLVSRSTCAGQSNATQQCTCFQDSQKTLINDIKKNCNVTNNNIQFVAPRDYDNATVTACSQTPAPRINASPVQFANAAVVAVLCAVLSLLAL